MSPMKAIKTFRDLLSFFTVIPLGKTEDFVVTTAEYIYLFPVVGAFIGLLGAAYFYASHLLILYVLEFVGWFLWVPSGFLLGLIPAVMTLAFLLVLSGLQHFDGLIDLGNALGLGNLEERRAAAHKWVVSYKGAVLAIIVEAVALLGLFFLAGVVAFVAIIASEVAAKLAMVTIAVVGKPTHKGLGSIFLESAKRERNLVAYVIAGIAVVPLLYVTGLGLAAGLSVLLISVVLGVLMGQVGKSVFGGVSGDMLGATNEVVRAAVLFFVAGVVLL